MKNLAGNHDADATVRGELSEAGIEIVDNGASFQNGEVPTRYTGRLGSTITMRRLWYYWSVRCRVPLRVAEEMYEHPVGRRDVRVAGHCGCPPPREWTNANDEIDCYHIDSPQGLRLFVETMHKHGLALS